MQLFWHSLPLTIRYWLARPRLLTALLLGIGLYILLPHLYAFQFTTRILVSWNSGVVFYLLFTLYMIYTSSKADIHQRARLQSEGKWTEILLVSFTTIAILAAITGELITSKNYSPLIRYEHIALACLTILTAWLFIQIIFTLHYAHHYYCALETGQQTGIVFPGDSVPNYDDFFYCACIIGIAGQTAEIAFSSSATRRIALVHSVLSFFFNTTLLALTINIASSLLT